VVSAGVPPLDDAVQDEARSSTAQEDLVAIQGVPPVLSDDVGVGLEERDQLVGRRDLLSLDDPTPGLVHHPCQESSVVGGSSASFSPSGCLAR